MGGFFLSFEGTEGCGKSTQARRLAAHLRQGGWPVLELREPGGTPLAEEIRHTLKHSAAGRSMTPEAELLLMNAARAQLVREAIRPALAAGEIVLCDRYLDSTLAYQGWGRQLDLNRVRQVIDFAVGPTRPDLTLYLAVSPAVAAARRRQRNATDPAQTDRFEAEEDAFFLRVEAGYRALAAEEPDRIVEIDASPAIDAVAEAIWTLVEPRLPRRDLVDRANDLYG